MVADMSDDELMLLLECLQAESASRGAGDNEAEPDDVGDAEIDPGMETAEDTLGAPESDVGQDGELVDEEAEPSAEPMEESMDGEDDMEMSKSADDSKNRGVHHGAVTKHGINESVGTSDAGSLLAMGRKKEAKDQHKKVLKELKGMKKPNLTKSDAVDSDLKKSIQYFIEKADQFFAAAQTPAPVASPKVVVKPMAYNRPVGQALEKSSAAPKVERLSKSDAINALLAVQKKEQNLPPHLKTVNTSVVADLNRAQGADAEKLIDALSAKGLLK